MCTRLIDLHKLELARVHNGWVMYLDQLNVPNRATSEPSRASDCSSLARARDELQFRGSRLARNLFIEFKLSLRNSESMRESC